MVILIKQVFSSKDQFMVFQNLFIKLDQFISVQKYQHLNDSNDRYPSIMTNLGT